MARPKKYNIDTKEVQNLARFGCTNIEIGDFFGCSPDTIEKGYSEYLTKGRAEQKLRLRQLQFKAAEKGSAAILIWLGKQILGQKDGIESTDDDKPLAWSYD